MYVGCYKINNIKYALNFHVSHLLIHCHVEVDIKHVNSIFLFSEAANRYYYNVTSPACRYCGSEIVYHINQTWSYSGWCHKAMDLLEIYLHIT